MKKLILIITTILIGTISVFSQSAASLDPSFNSLGTAALSMPMLTLPQINCKHLVQPDGKIVMCSNSIISPVLTEVMVTRLTSNGSLDLTFGNSGTFNYSITLGFNLAVGLVIQPDGKLVTSGIFNDGTGVNNNEIFILRLNANGTLDNSFGINGISTWNFSPDNERVTDLKIMPFGGFAISGYIQSSQSADSAIIIKVTSSGQLDNAFATNGIFKYQHNGRQTDLYSLEIFADNSIIAAGSYNSASNYQDVFALKMDSTGTFDSSFGVSGIYERDVFNDYDEIHALKILANKEVLLAGYSYNGNNDGSLVIKLDSIGNEITSFGNNGISSYTFANTPSRCYDMEVQNNGKIVLAGEYADTITGLYDFMVLRLLANGSPDVTFNTTLPYVTTDFLADDDGASSVVIQSDGKILVYGTAIQNTTTLEDSPALARYLGDVVTDIIEPISTFEDYELYPIPTINNLNVHFNSKNNFLKSIIINDVLGNELLNIKTLHDLPLNASRFSNGLYFIKIEENGKYKISKFIKQ